ncbi:CatB-related O-acetyltransferase [Cetobacterium sp.]|uniref:CatB-related O-acetyltransferase n=1 Tax=Cetobacterium sp. TaxID=2071632 RepID=UPI003F678D49
MNKFDINIVEVGEHSYGPIIVKSWNRENEKLIIGKYVSIAEGVKFLLGGNHEINTITTYPFKVKFLKEKVEAWTKGPIVIKDDVWIGTDTLILSGVIIGQGAIIAAGSVVVKDVPPYAIIGGNPAKVIKYRYSNDIVDEMITFDWSKVKTDNIKNLKEALYQPLTLEMAKKLKKEFERGTND